MAILRLGRMVYRGCDVKGSVLGASKLNMTPRNLHSLNFYPVCPDGAASFLLDALVYIQEIHRLSLRYSRVSKIS